MSKTILRNLISNALKFTKIGGVVSISGIVVGDFLEIQITDNGLGISAEHQLNLFRIDKNVSTQGTSDELGSGIGLLLCKELVEKQNGQIWVDSEEGRGSKFCFTLEFVSSL